MNPTVGVEVRRNRHGSVLAYADRDRAARLLADHRAVLQPLYDLVDRRHGSDGDIVARLAVREDARTVDELDLRDQFRRDLEADRAISLVEDLRYHAGERELVTDGGTPEPATPDDPYDNWIQMLQATAARFEEENDDLEALLDGAIGFHTYFTVGDDPTRGTQAAIYQGVYEALEEVSLNAGLVEMRRGEVTPETVWQEVDDQINEHAYLSDDLRDPIRERVKQRVERNLQNMGESR